MVVRDSRFSLNRAMLMSLILSLLFVCGLLFSNAPLSNLMACSGPIFLITGFVSPERRNFWALASPSTPPFPRFPS